MSRESAMITKLKEGLQEALVFLRQLGDFKIPAVMERRRKGLLDKLLELQGDTFRGGDTAPLHDKPEEKAPAAEPTTEKLKSPAPAVEEEEEHNKVTPSVTSPTRGSPTKRLSKGDSKISALVGNYEHITTVAKQEEVAETPKRFVQLKKVAKPTDFPDPDTDTAKEEEEEAAHEEAEKQTHSEKENGTLKPKRPSSTVSEEYGNVEVATEAVAEGEEGEDQDGGEKESSKKKGKFKGFKKIGKLGDKLKKRHKGGREKSPSRAVEDEEEKSGASEAEEPDKEEPSTPPEELEEGVRIAGTLERKVTSRFKSKWVKVYVKLKDNVLYIGDKDRMELVDCMVATTDVGFDVVNHSTQKQLHFKIEGEENDKEKWVDTLNTVIQECTPEQEEPEEEGPIPESEITPEHVPSITIEEPVPANEEEPASSTLKRKREGKAMAVPKAAPARKLPEQGVEMKGYIHRKKAGLGSRWDKTYCVLTYQAIYFTTMQDNTEYNNMLALSGDTIDQRTLSESKKGHDKNSMGINLKIGKSKEQLSFESSEFHQWKGALERVLGIGGVEELLSEDEEIEPDIGGEELYEELEADDLPPPVPSSPRPAHTPLNVPDDIIIDEDIYEDTDDYQQDFQESPSHSAPPPALPDRNPPKIATAPAPSLPPRNALPPKKNGLALPPRGAKEEHPAIEKSPVTNPPAKTPAPPPDIGGEEIYDDVVPEGGDQDGEMDETYDDVVVGEADEMEETYDDVVTTPKSPPPRPPPPKVIPAKTNAKANKPEPEPITEEFYEDMAPVTDEGPQEDYVMMEPGEDVGGEELYVDVDAPPPPKTIAQPKPAELDAKLTNSPRTAKSGTFSRMFKTKPASPQPERKGHGQEHSGMIGHKAPKKSKFEDRWAVIEGNFLIISKNQGAKSHTDKLPLSECGLDIGSPDVGPGEHAFRISTKGDKVHHFKLKSRPDYDKWVSIVKGLTKYAPMEIGTVARGEQEVYQAKEDHIGESEGQLTFKKGTYIRLISKDGDEWVGQIGNEAQVFEGKIGKFPMSKVELAEDLYI